MWRFPEPGVLPVIIHFRLGFCILNPPAIGVPPWNPPYDFRVMVPGKNISSSGMSRSSQRVFVLSPGVLGQYSSPKHCMWASVKKTGAGKHRLLMCLSSKWFDVGFLHLDPCELCVYYMYMGILYSITSLLYYACINSKLTRWVSTQYLKTHWQLDRGHVVLHCEIFQLVDVAEICGWSPWTCNPDL